MPATVEPTVTHTCAHCALPVPPGLVQRDETLQFCCAGCRAVYDTVQSCGLDTYYRLRDSAQASLAPASPGKRNYEAFDAPSFRATHVTANDGLLAVDLALEGVTCAACVWLIEKLPRVLPGVVEARLSLRQATVRITWQPERLSLSQIARALDGFGYVPHAARGAEREALYRREYRDRLVKLGAAGALMGNLMLLAAALYAGWIGGIDSTSATMLRWLSLGLGVLSLAWPGAEFFRSALTALRHRTINLDVPIALALLTGGVAGTASVLTGHGELYFDSLSALVFLLLVGRFMQFRQQRSAESSVELLLTLTPSTCRVVEPDGGTHEIPLQGLTAGQLTEVRPGELIPADGVVDAGASSVDQALLTGESVPVPVAPGSRVFGGSRNTVTTLRVRIEHVGPASRVGQLMALLERGLTDKPDIVRFADRVGVVFTFAVSVLAAAVFAHHARTDLSAAISHTVAFLIVTCPCVLGLAGPMTLAISIGQLARRDILVKSAAVLEKLARAGRDHARLMLDKTGTLTLGRLRVDAFHGDESLLGVVAAVESESNHPVARALHDAYSHIEPPAELRAPVCARREAGDGGISAFLGDRQVFIGSEAFLARHGIAVSPPPHTHGRGLVFVALAGVHRGTIVLTDPLRPNTRSAVAALSAQGFVPEIHSGDADFVVAQVARDVGIEPRLAYSAVTPEQKLEAVRSERVRQTVMVGDGVNDSAALAAASVGIAVHGAAEASLAAADIYLARPGLAGVVDVCASARRTMRVIRICFAVSAAYNILAGTLAAVGMMNPLIAAILMPASSASVLGLSAYLMKRGNPAA
jgi:P-type Cu2+ transporter